MLLTLLANVTLVKLLHCWNVELPMLVRPLPMITLVTPEQRKNATSPILVTLLGIVTFNDLQGDQQIARRPLPRLSLFDELETNAGVDLRFA